MALCCVMMLTLCAAATACGSKEPVKSTSDLVRDAVKYSGMTEYIFKSIGGNEIKSSMPEISTLKEISDTEYRVSGSMIMTDVYGTRWKNNFDVTVTYDETNQKWKAGSFNYTGNNWIKQ